MMSAIKFSSTQEHSCPNQEAINLSIKKSCATSNQRQGQFSNGSQSFLIRNILNLNHTKEQSKLHCTSDAHHQLGQNPASSVRVENLIGEFGQGKIISSSETKSTNGPNKQSNIPAPPSHYHDDDDDDVDGSLFTLKRSTRTMFSQWQLANLEWRFARNKYLTTSDRKRVAKVLALNQLQVKTWFQNRRMKWKKQILATGCDKSPTKPKGRPRRDSIPPIDD